MGGTRTAILNTRLDLTDLRTTSALGRYWLLGGGIGIALTSRVALEASVRYQSSTFTVPGPDDDRRVGAGMVMGVGLGVYLR
jgi:hypothetical protein